jgi:hypothetical protein
VSHTVFRVRFARCALVVLAMSLLVSSAAQAEIRYQAQVIARAGDPVGDITTGAKQLFAIGDLNDRGYLALVTGDPATESNAGGALVQYADGQWITLARHGRPGAPQGAWPLPTYINLPFQMNQKGNLVFSAQSGKGQAVEYGTYRWDAAARTVTPVAVKGMPAVNGLTFEQGGFFSPVVNNRDEIAFPAAVKNAAGKAANGIFFIGQDGNLLTVVLPGQEIPGGATFQEAFRPSINDSGSVTFLTLANLTSSPNGAYLWERGVPLTLIATKGTLTTEGKQVSEVTGAWVNNNNRAILVAARVAGVSGHGLYRFADGQLKPLVVRGQEMPGGGQLADVDALGGAVSWANDAGQHAFYAQLVDGARGAYLLNADGTLSLIVKTGTNTEVGAITRIAPGESGGVALNNKGQVALPVQIGDGPNSVVLFSPVNR